MPNTPNTNDNPFLRKKIPPPELVSQELVSQELDREEKTVFQEGEEVVLKISIIQDDSEGVGQTSQAYAVSKLPDVCLVDGEPVPFQIKGDFGTADEEHPTVRFRSFKAITTRSFVPQVTGDQLGKDGGIISGCNKGVAYIEKDDIVRTVRVNGEKVVRHGDLVRMNASSHGGAHNTIGEVYYKPQLGTATKVRISETGEIDGDTNPPVTLETPQEENWFQQQLANAKELAGQAWNKIKELNKEYKLVQRGMGVVQVVGGVGEIVLGVLGWVAPEPTMVTKVLGTVAIVHGVDDTWAGLKQARTGKSQDNYTQQMATGVAKKMGASENVAEWIGVGTDIGVGLVNPIGALKKVAVETAEEGVEKIVKETVEEVSEEATEQAGKKTAQQAGEETVEQAGIRVTRQLKTFTQTTIDEVIESSRATRKGGQITEGKRALEKKIGHAQAKGYKSAFEGIPFTQENAEKLIRDILVNPNRTFIGDQVIDAYDTLGRGVRFDRATGKFIGFLEEALAKL